MSGSLVAVDIGNSFVHATVYRHNGDAALKPQSLTRAGASYVTTGVDELELLTDDVNDWFVSSVNRKGLARLRDWLKRHRPTAKLRVLDSRDFPIQVLVSEPDRVGVDRLAAAVAANELRNPDRSAIVVDAGTAITVDLLDDAGSFRGGVILAGGRIMSLALAERTDALPNVAVPSSPPNVVGDSTRAAIASGLYWGTLGAVRECITQIRRGLDHEPDVFVTGGGANWLPELGARHAGDLTLAGVAIVGQRLQRGADQ